ncbi:MAG: TRIC cation channel family protein, partial [Myxococcota bacterium]
ALILMSFLTNHDILNVMSECIRPLRCWNGSTVTYVYLAVAFACANAWASNSTSQDTHRDPISGLPVTPETAFGQSVHEGKTVYFVSKRSLQTFEKNPKKNIDPLLVLGGWYPWMPYQYLQEKKETGKKELQGLDIAVLREVAKDLGIEIQFDQVSWKQHQLDIQDGSRDLAAGAFRTPQRETFAYYSIPYRKETNALYLPKKTPHRFRFKTPEEMVEHFKKIEFRLGVVAGYAYVGDTLNNYVRKHTGTPLIVPAQTEEENFYHLFNGKIDGFLTDRVVGATLAWKHGWMDRVQEYSRVQPQADIYLIFSKESTSPSLVQAFNQSLKRLKDNGRYQELVSEYVFPVLLLQTIEREWFFSIDILGTIAFALSGVILARRGKFDFFGALLLAALPALGGGAIRDVLVSRIPIGTIRTPHYLYAILITVSLGFMLLRIHGLIKKYSRSSRYAQLEQRAIRILTSATELFDALGLAAFTIIGVVVAVEAQFKPLWLWGPLLATISTTGGGILRDLISHEPQIKTIRGSFYPIVSILWGLFLSGALILQTTRINPDEIFLAVIITLIGAFCTRLLAIWLNWKTPLY